MNQAILISIKPIHSNKIYTGEKKFEFRKRAPKRSTSNRVIIYSSYPVSAITGEFTASNLLFLELNELWRETKKYAGISEAFFLEYFKDMKFGYAIEISDQIQYKTPIEIQSIGIKHPPQSFMYISTDQLITADMLSQKNIPL